MFVDTRQAGLAISETADWEFHAQPSLQTLTPGNSSLFPYCPVMSLCELKPISCFWLTVEPFTTVALKVGCATSSEKVL